MSDNERVFARDGNFVRFNQRGTKFNFPNDIENESYYEWLDSLISGIGTIVSGASVVEKPAERANPRRNSGVYYDTHTYQLLHGHMVLRTTSNPITHAFCAFKLGVDSEGVRRDHRFVFDGDDKLTIQRAPSSPEAIAAVRRLLAREDIVHPGVIMRELTGITGDQLTPALRLVQDRRTFYVLIDGTDALRCSLDRADVEGLRSDSNQGTASFSEVELAIFPRISDERLADHRTWKVLDSIGKSLAATFQVTAVTDSKYRRAAFGLGILNETA